MQAYEILPHTADVIILARGSSKEELFRAALDGLCSVVVHEPGNKQADFSFVIEIESIDISPDFRTGTPST